MDRFEANVVEGEEARIELRAEFDGPHPGAFAPGELTEASYSRERSRISFGRRTDDEQGASGGWLLQQLELQWLRYAPGRDFILTGLPTLDGAFVALNHLEGAGCDWRAPISDGKAVFPSIPLGEWRAVLVRPGEQEVSVDVDVVKGDGALTIALPAAK